MQIHQLGRRHHEKSGRHAAKRDREGNCGSGMAIALLFMVNSSQGGQSTLLVAPIHALVRFVLAR